MFSLINYHILTNFALILLFFTGILLLTLGSSLLLRGAVGLAKLLHINKYSIGLTVVALSTSMPEFFVSVNASFSEQQYLAFTNVIGSNIFNTLFLYMIFLIFSSKISKVNIWSVVLVTLLHLLILGLTFTRAEQVPRIIGALFLLLLIIYFRSQLRIKQKFIKQDIPVETEQQSALPFLSKFYVAGKFFALIILGTFMLYAGSELLLDSVIELALRTGISQKIAGLFIISIGTGLPELFVILNVLAFHLFTRQKGRGYLELGEGNLLGSNIINILLIIGTTSLIQPIEKIGTLRVEIILLLLSNAVLLVLLQKKIILQRILGFVFFASYVLYLCYLF